MDEPEPLPQILTPCPSGRKSFGDSNSPEFEFWMLRNPSFPPPKLLSADQLFSGGVLLPLHHLRLSDDTPTPHPEPSGSDQPPPPETSATVAAESSASSSLTSSKRWRDIFRKNDKKIPQASTNVDPDDRKERENSVKEKRREKKNGGSTSSAAGAIAAELNINIWPFSRSRSAGNGGTRPRPPAAANRKVSSAPCSRSNSRGESKSRKWPSSPARAGVHVGRTSPVWQVRRSSGAAAARISDAAAEKVVKKDGNEGRRKVPVAGGGKGKALSLNVPMCIGYRQQLSCRSDENSSLAVAATGGAGEGVRGSNLFNIKSLFGRKVY